MTTENPAVDFNSLEERICDLVDPEGLAELTKEILKLEEQASGPGVWEDREAA